MRDNRLDVIRGFAILLLTITHTSPGQQVLDEYGNYYIWLGFFFHVADLFVAFSGLVCGIVYKRIMQREGRKAGISKGLSRAAQLFIFNACAFVVVWAVIKSFGAFGIEGPIHKAPDSFAQAAFGTILLYDPIPFFNILNFYILMLIALPFFCGGAITLALAHHSLMLDLSRIQRLAVDRGAAACRYSLLRLACRLAVHVFWRHHHWHELRPRPRHPAAPFENHWADHALPVDHALHA